MRILHTSDLHLGRLLYGTGRDGVFEKFLTWLLETIEKEEVNCLVIAGDVFDTATPSHFSQRLYYRFLAAAAGIKSCRHIVVTGGNHDSSSFLNAPRELLAAFNIIVIGRAADEPVDEVFLLKDDEGKPEAVIAAVPYLRERDLRTSVENQSEEEKEALLRAGVSDHYRRATEAAMKLRGKADIPYIATGHLFAAGCSAGSDERTLYIGSLGLIPADVFGPEIDYLALGHLHRAQKLTGDETRRYAGSPVVLDFSERVNAKSIVIVDTDGRKCTPRLIEVPAFDRLEQVTGSREAILEKLHGLTAQNEAVLCEVLHTEGTTAPDLALLCRDATEGSPVHIVRVINRTASDVRIAEGELTADELETLDPKTIFELRLGKAGDEIDESEKENLRKAHEEILACVENPNEEEDR